VRAQKLQEKLKVALLKKIEEHKKDVHPMTFDRIILKHKALQSCLVTIKQVFLEFANKQTKQIDLQGLKDVMARLHGGGNVSTEEVFNFVDLDSSNSIDLREFLVALTVALVLDDIPALGHSPPLAPLAVADVADVAAAASDGSTSVPPPPSPPITPTVHRMRRSVSNFFGQDVQIKDNLNLIVSAYLLCDTLGEGVIRREAVDALIGEKHEGKYGANTGHKAIIANLKWDELEWDHENKTCDFGSFVYTFERWFDLEGEEEPLSPEDQ